jgi:hypothetical protein
MALQELLADFVSTNLASLRPSLQYSNMQLHCADAKYWIPSPNVFTEPDPHVCKEFPCPVCNKTRELVNPIIVDISPFSNDFI